MKLFWQGTDSLMLVDYSMRRWVKRPYWWLFRRFVRLSEFFVVEHYCDSVNIVQNLRRFNLKRPITVKPDHLLHTKFYNKKPHKSFNILYYCPMGGDVDFRKWLYGYDFFKEVQNALIEENVKFIFIDGRGDMEYIFPYVDFYLRPNRHDGASRLRQECELQNIPYYWTQKNPTVDGAIKEIRKHLRLHAKKNI